MSKFGRTVTRSAVSAVIMGIGMAGLLAAPAQAAPLGDGAAEVEKTCDRKVTVGNARNKGDIFHSVASTVMVEHNHVGIYASTSTIVEAPGPNRVSWSRTAAEHRVCGPVYKMSVNTVQGNRNNAANYAFTNLRGRPYDASYANNKLNSDANLNSSELVWKAYQRRGNIDLDANGGPGVYPDDIKNDGSTMVYQTIG